MGSLTVHTLAPLSLPWPWHLGSPTGATPALCTVQVVLTPVLAPALLIRVPPPFSQVTRHVSVAKPVTTEHFLQPLGKKCSLPGDTC